MKKTGVISMLLVCLLVFSALAGCGFTPVDIDEKPTETNVPVSRKYYAKTWHGDVAYSDLEYERYQVGRFDEYTEPFYNFAKGGGSRQDFIDADDAIYSELCYVFTMYNLADIAHYQDPSDTAAADEVIYAKEAYYKVNDAFWNAMHTLANSQYSRLLDAVYGDSIISAFESYEPPDDIDAELELSNAEDRLVQQYYALIAESEPDFEAIGEIYVELVDMRNERARSYDYDSYAEYAYESYYYKDYTPEDAEAVHDGAKDYFVPLMARYYNSIASESQRLHYSDKIDCSPEAVLDAMAFALPQISRELNKAYEYMVDYGLCDIEQDGRKANTGFTTKLYSVNQPFIFNAAMDSFYDYTDMFHEFGHFVNSFYTSSDLLFGASDNDLSELQSQGMEIIFTHFYTEIFGEDAGDVILDDTLMNMVTSVVDGAMYDEFQMRVFREKNLTSARVNDIFTEVYEDYGYMPYDGYEYEWMYISHNFDYPFYYISYAVSALGALELYDLSERSWPEAVDKYLTISAMDTEAYYYSEALDEAGFRDIFSQSTYRDIADTLEKSFSN